MTDKTELTREEVERLCSTVGGSPLAVEVLPGTWRWYKWPPPPEWEQALAMAPVAYRQLLATMDDNARLQAAHDKLVAKLRFELQLCERQRKQAGGRARDRAPFDGAISVLREVMRTIDTEATEPPDAD